MKRLAAVFIVLAAVLAFVPGVSALTVTDATGSLIVSNDAGRFYTGGTTNPVALLNTDPSFRTFNYVTGGTNQLKINSTATINQPALLTGTATTSGTYGGNFWITTNGGRGGNDDIILGVALTGPISNDFKLTIQSNGYVVAPSLSGMAVLDSSYWQTNVVNESFYGSDFIYGPQATRPVGGNQALYNGQGSATGMLMFVDLGVANRNANNQSDQVVFSIEGLYGGNVLAFSAYAYTYANPHGGVADPDVLGWTTPTLSTGYTVTGSGAAPVPIPAAVWFFGPALAGLVGMGRRLFRK